VSIAGRPGARGAQRARSDQRHELPRPTGPARRHPRIALATCRQLPAGDEDSPPLLAACAAAGLDAEWRVWDDPAVDWASYDLAVIRATWDYAPRRDDFAAWAASVPRLANPADIVAWNTDKTYLRDLAAAGVPVVDTVWLSPGDTVEDVAFTDVVVKPTISTGSRDTARYVPGEEDKARDHASRLLAAGRPAMVQPYVAGVDEAGETAVVHLGGAYSHALRKGPLLAPGQPDQTDALWRPEEITAREPSDAELALATRALAEVPGGPGRLLYARVDLLPGPDGDPVVIEVELAEPSLFLLTVPDAADRLAAAIRAAVQPG
jgi:glutathione synthase/RimK-type ligase-like ATP-grasp enzyme